MLLVLYALGSPYSLFIAAIKATRCFCMCSLHELLVEAEGFLKYISNKEEIAGEI